MAILFNRKHEVDKEDRLYGIISVTMPDMCELLKTYNDLNDTGKSEAIKRIQELAELPEYKKQNNMR